MIALLTLKNLQEHLKSSLLMTEAHQGTCSTSTWGKLSISKGENFLEGASSATEDVPRGATTGSGTAVIWVIFQKSWKDHAAILRSLPDRFITCKGLVRWTLQQGICQVPWPWENTRANKPRVLRGCFFRWQPPGRGDLLQTRTRKLDLISVHKTDAKKGQWPGYQCSK